MPLYAHEVIERIEDAIAALTPAETAGDNDRFVVDYGEARQDDATTRDADRTVVVGDLTSPARKGSSGGCEIATMTVQVSISYGVGRDSRRRRLRDAWQVQDAIRAVRGGDISRCTPTPDHTLLVVDLQMVLQLWRVDLEFYTYPSGS